MIERRGLELKRERDETIARNAYNEFEKASTEFLYDEETGLLNQTGESVYNLDDQYREWFGKLKSDYMEKRFDTDAQAESFDKKVEAAGLRDLKFVAKHIVDEHKANKKRSIDNYLVEAEGRIRKDPMNADEIIKGSVTELKKTYPDEWDEVQVKQIEGRGWSAAVQETMVVDASAALDMIEAHKEELGAAYSTWKKKAEAERDRQLYNETIAEVRNLYPGDYDKQEDSIRSRGLDPKDERSLISTIRGDEAEAKGRKAKFKKEQRDQQLHNGVYGLVREGNFGDAITALKNIPSDIVNEQEKLAHEQRINNLWKNPAEIDDTAAYDKWFGDIAIAPQSVDPNILLSDNRLTGGPNGTRERLYKWYLSRMKGGKEGSSSAEKRLKPMLEVMKVKEKNFGYLSEDERVDMSAGGTSDDLIDLALKNQTLYQQDQMDLVTWSIENQDANILDYYGKEQVEEVKKSGWTSKLWDLFVNPGGGAGAEFAERRTLRTIPSPKSDISPIGEGNPIVRRGVHNGRPVNQYADGSIKYAD
jgi:hypothetical protein